MKSVQIFAEYLYYDGGAKYVMLDRNGQIRQTDIVPGLEKIVLQSSESIDIGSSKLFFEYSRFQHDGELITWFGCYAAASDWQLGNRGNINCVGVWVVGGLVNFGSFIDAVQELINELGRRTRPDVRFKKIIVELEKTSGQWLLGEDELGILWAKEYLDRKTVVIKERLNDYQFKRLINNLSRFGDDIPCFDKIKNCTRVFINTDESWNAESSVNDLAGVSEEDISVSIIHRFAECRKHDKVEIKRLIDEVDVYKSLLSNNSKALNVLEHENQKIKKDLQEQVSYINNDEEKLRRIKSILAGIEFNNFETNLRYLNSLTDAQKTNIDKIDRSTERLVDVTRQISEKIKKTKNVKNEDDPVKTTARNNRNSSWWQDINSEFVFVVIAALAILAIVIVIAKKVFQALTP